MTIQNPLKVDRLSLLHEIKLCPVVGLKTLSSPNTIDRGRRRSCSPCWLAYVLPLLRLLQMITSPSLLKINNRNIFMHYEWG